MHAQFLFINAFRAPPGTGNLVVRKSHATVMKPLDGTVVIVAGNHFAEGNTAADAVQRLVWIHFNIEIRDIGRLLLATAANVGT